MYLSKYILRRRDQICIIQGMQHWGPQGLYARLQSDLDYAVSINFNILIENIGHYKKHGEEKPTLCGKVIKHWLKTLAHFQNGYSALSDQVTEDDTMSYPQNAIDADIDYNELVSAVEEKRLASYFFLYGFMLRCILSMARLEMRWHHSLSSSDRLKDKATNWFKNKTYSVIIEKRDRKVVDFIEKFAYASRRVFVHFGEDHISGIIEILKKHDWEVINIIELEVSNI